RFTNIACPVLVLGSKDDVVLGGEASEALFESLKDRPDCELYMYEGYGHAAYDLAPDYKDRMLSFFR
ncbi:MAG: alpha/beta hydrolase, partial [Lachnospiraceae bacterium]|nr:alpha/beta hydrolase [Lachnospiraceae bacterium]